MAFPPLTIDLEFSRAVQQFHPAWLTTFMKVVSAIISPEAIFVLGLLTTAYLYFRKHDPQTIAKIFFVAIGNLLIPILKDLVARPRPGAGLVQVFVHETGFSFPSGHALGIVLFGGIVVLLIGRLAHHHQRLLFGFVSLVIFLVGYSRVYLGVHWLSDVLAGYVIGLIWIILALQMRWPKLSRWTK